MSTSKKFPTNIKSNQKSFYNICALMEEFKDFVKDHKEVLEEWNIDTSCLDWHLDCVEMCADRIAYHLYKIEIGEE